VPYFVMPLLKGVSLEEYLRRGKGVSVGQALRIAKDVARGPAWNHYCIRCDGERVVVTFNQKAVIDTNSQGRIAGLADKELPRSRHGEEPPFAPTGRSDSAPPSPPRSASTPASRSLPAG
jgi:hypothetical protein